MKIFFSALLLFSTSLFAQIDQSRQLLVVIAKNWNADRGQLYLFERNESDEWTTIAGPWDVMLGDSGLAWGTGLYDNPPDERQKIEGDHRSPAGVFELGDFFGYDSIPPAGIKFPYHYATKTLHCVDDTGSVFYNSLVHESQVIRDSAGHLPWKSSEVMRLDSVDYKYGIVVKNNPHAIPGLGSCIFLHLNSYSHSPTVGCTAMDEDKMLQLMHWLDPQQYPLLVQLPYDSYVSHFADWNLPSLPVEQSEKNSE
ncbi:MAG: L,D-transpeptidase family protein [Bacteroidota bacterium]|nr:L,D-transpeptidase family protein [Bacteroidota bacterium]